MFYLYILQSLKDNQYYIGSTNDLNKRLNRHNSGRSLYTKKFMPWKLIYNESYPTRALAFKREYALKRRAKAWQLLKKKILEAKR